MLKLLQKANLNQIGLTILRTSREEVKLDQVKEVTLFEKGSKAEIVSGAGGAQTLGWTA